MTENEIWERFREAQRELDELLCEINRKRREIEYQKGVIDGIKKSIQVSSKGKNWPRWPFGIGKNNECSKVSKGNNR